MAPTPIRLMLADVDGTLVTQEKVLTDRAVAAVHDLHAAGIRFAVTSGRPPRGMEMLVEPLALDTPIAAFNGGLFVHPDMTVIEQQVLPSDEVPPTIGLMGSFGLGVWVYRGADWYVLDSKGPHVDREQWTVKFDPTVVPSFDGLTDDVAKIVGVSDDLDAVARAEATAHAQFGDHVSAARSQPYYLDVTHPQANKGGVVAYLAKHFAIEPAADRDDRRPAQRRPDVRALGPQHRDGQRERGRPAPGDEGDDLERGRRLRERGRAVRPLAASGRPGRSRWSACPNARARSAPASRSRSRTGRRRGCAPPAGSPPCLRPRSAGRATCLRGRR